MAIRLLSSESIDGTFKIGSGSLTNPSTNADDIVIDNGAGVETGMTFASSVASSIRFGDFTNNSIGSIEYIHTGNHLRFITNGTERVRITGVGNVGIGISPPADHKLQIHNPGESYARFALTNSNTGSASGDGLIFQMETLNSIIKNQEAGYLTFGTSGRETDLHIDSSGDVGIGTGSPAHKLDLTTSDTTWAAAIKNTNATNGYGLFLQSAESASKAILGAYSGSSYKFYVRGDGNVGIGTTGPTQPLEILAAGGYDKSSSGGQTTNGILIKGGATAGDQNTTGGIGFSFGTGTAGISGYQNGSDQDRVGLSFYTHGSGTGSGASQETMRIKSGGEVGIGTTNPGAKLHVNSENTASTVIIGRTGTNIAASTSVGTITFPADYNSSAANYAQIRAYSNALSSLRGSLDFNVKSTSGSLLTGLTLYGTNSGVNVGIGLIAPAAKLHVEGRNASNVINAQMLIGYSGNSQNFFDADSHYFRNSAFVNILQLGADTILGTPNNTQRLKITDDYSQIGPLTYKYPYYRVDSFKSDGSGYFWAFGHEKSDGTQSIGMMLNDGVSGNKYTRIINTLQIASFASNEYNGAYPSFTTNVVLRNSGISYLNGGNVGIGVTSPQARLQTNLTITGSLLAYLNGTSATFDAQANIAVVHNSPSIGSATAAGLVLANNDKSDGAPSPIIAFSAKSASNSFNHTYAAIYGVRTATGADTNWTKGDIVLATGSGTGPNERMRITSRGQIYNAASVAATKNTFYGKNAGYSLSTGSSNTMFGSEAGASVASGSANTLVGSLAGQYTTGNYNTCIGSSAGNKPNMTGSNHTMLGYTAGDEITTGTNCIAIGFAAGSGSSPRQMTTNSNEIVIGSNAIVGAYVRVAWTTGSDKRDKINFSNVPHGLDFVNKLKPTSYSLRKERDSDEIIGKRKYGFLAQEILELEGENPVIIDNSDENKLALQDSNLIPILVNAIQELKAEIEILKSK